MKKYYFENNEFVIRDFDKQKTFASFLPGMAGKRGIPLWAFYVNRGQGISSFGLENKDKHILEFSPAVKAYKTVGIDGFRTFVKINGKTTEIFGENDVKCDRYMKIKRSEFTIEEHNHELGLNFKMTYFGLPNDNIAALVRIVEVTNVSGEKVSFELLDGVSKLLPSGVSLGDMKFLANLMRSWMDVYSLDKNVGFFRMRSSTSDSAEVVEVKNGNFYVSSFENELVKPIVDQRLIFDYETTKRRARFFENHSIKEIYETEQVTANKIPVGFTGLALDLEANKTARINTLIGHIHTEELLLERAADIVKDSYVDQKRKEAAQVLDDMLDEVSMESNLPIFDDYIKQNYLDNILRGGYPMIIDGEDKNFVYHLFSRRHGDLERDYNYFTIAPEFYSQGNGNFRDVAQNRRSDVLLNPAVADFNMKMFGSFIQADGYNPLSIDGSSFKITNRNAINELTETYFNNNDTIRELLSNAFTPGSLINTMANLEIECDLSDNELFTEVFKHTEQQFEAHYGEGYWIDHWTYILDLIENYEAIYPEKIDEKLFDDITYKYFESPIFVLPRSEKICLTNDGKVRRFGSILHDDHEKITRLGMNPAKAHWLKNHDGSIIYGSLFEKLFVLAINKISSLDPSGMGIEMEADKPGWNDAMNGLPGLFGSGVSETIELKRIVQFMKKHFDLSRSVKFPIEFKHFIEALLPVIKNEMDDFKYWHSASSGKEEYRQAIRFNTNGLEYVDASLIDELLSAMELKIDMALSKAYRYGDGIYPTYLVHEVTDYVQNMDGDKIKYGNYGLPTVTPKGFRVRALPYYLEAPARALKVMKNESNKQTMFKRIKMSNIYDHELKVYKTSEFLDKESNEIGRGRSFTKGWQERESNFLHMTYKYLLGLLKGGLHEEFFGEIETNLTCFMDPEVYGRSTLENSSFIATSINPDPFVRGQGYVARLSGSTAEMLSIWAFMMYGKKPFIVQDGSLTLNLKPVLTKEYFKNGKLSFTFLGHTKVTYINDGNKNTFDKDFQIDHYVVDGEKVDSVSGLLARKVRDRQVKEIHVYCK